MAFMLCLRGIVLRITRFYSVLSAFSLILLLLLVPSGIHATVPMEEAAKLLPDQLGEYRAVTGARALDDKLIDSDMAQSFNALSSAGRAYTSAKGSRFNLAIIKMRSDSDAYALLTNAATSLNAAESGSPQTVKIGGVGTASIVSPDRILFFKGPALVAVNRLGKAANEEAMLGFASLFAESLDKGEGDIPVLVRHLPDWEKAQERALYATTLDTLKSATGNQPILDAVSFEGGAQAVTATYGQARLVIVENTTPQLATDNDARIQGRLKELREQGQSIPSAYQRVGNYSVFVFDAQDEAAAAELIKGISYEQVVQWLGHNPRALERMQRQYTNTMAGVIIAVFKASGLAILLCLGIGGIFGGLVFQRRRAQQATSESYSDAGDMVRLNIDGISAQHNPTRLLGRGEG
jgi:hypothetical protein